MIRWLLAAAVGIGAWHLAVWGATLSFWPSLAVWLLFWITLDVYARLENARD